MRFVSYTDRKAVAAALRPIYTAPTVDAAESELLAFADSSWGKKYPAAVATWESAWERFIPFLAFPPELRKIIYTTNAIEVPHGFRTVDLIGSPSGMEGMVPERRRKFTPEYREEAVKAVIETSRPIAQVARELGIVEGTLGNWVAAYRRDHAGEEPPLGVSERARLRELEREVRELRLKNEFLGKAAAFFAQEYR